ncbi:hypothetical protein DL96DRAFT_1624215 [Flagelloscypha sp. PMI_526]|nr:hypothetical protein DL96DRAFT_1624215 [Flagelloscypha sp. PMI_526]
MRQSRSSNRQSFFGRAATAHGHSGAQSQIPQTTVESPSTFVTGLNTAGTALRLAKDAGEAAGQIPYVKAVAGVLSQIIKIREDIQANKERCYEIIDLVHLKSTTILQSLDIVYHANGAEGFEDMESDLEAYADFLRGILRDRLEPQKKQSRFISYLIREKNAGDLQKLERELEEFNSRFLVKRQVAMSVDARTAVMLLSKPVSPPELIPQALPASPKFVIGREPVVGSIVQAIISSNEPRIAILGPGGVGKTTLGTAVLHDTRVVARYQTRYFVSCERSPTVDVLLTQIADTLSIPQANRGTNLTSLIIHHIRSDANSVLFYIDNLETVWEVDAEQAKVDHFLEVLSGIGSKLVLMVTMRGIQEPKTSFPWNCTILSGLVERDSTAMYEALSGKSSDPPARELLLKLSGSPLAIKLFALMVKEGDQPSQLLSSWDEHGTKALEVGGTHRLSNLDQSIHLSVFSPRIDDTARRVLGLVALMPDGLSTSQDWFEGFASILPDSSLLQPTLRTLRRAALLELNGETSRWQMLPPIRQFCRRLSDSFSSAVSSLVELYVRKVIEHWDHTSSASHPIVLPEMGNIRAFLLHGSTLQPFPPLIGDASQEYAGWAYWQNIDESAFLSSFLHLPIPTRHKAYIYRRLGIIHLHWERLDAAEASFIHSLELFTDAGSLWGQADTRVAIGNLELRRNQLYAADTMLNSALERYLELQSHLGEANTRRSLGDLHVCLDHFDIAEASFTAALELYVEVQHPWGEANTHDSLGALHLRRSQYSEAEASFSRALELYIQVHHRWGEANTHKSIGSVRLRQNRPDSAKLSFKLALKQFIDIQDRREIAGCTFLLGQVCLHMNDLEAAATTFSQALTLWKDVDDKLGIAQTHQAIGDLHLQRHQLDDAALSLQLALDLYTTQVKSQRDEALTRRSINDLTRLRHQFNDNGPSFEPTPGFDVLSTNLYRRLERIQRELGNPLSQSANYHGDIPTFYLDPPSHSDRFGEE